MINVSRQGTSRAFARLSVAAFVVGVLFVSSLPAHATEGDRTAALADVFSCPPITGIYPEPDPCVPTPPPPPVPVAFTTSLDVLPVAPDWYCEPETKPGIARFRRLLDATYNIGGSTERDCDASWSYEFSYHKMGLALDWMVDTTDPDGWASGLSLLRWLLAPDPDGNDFAMARRVGVTQLIWHNRVWSTLNPTWQVYCDPRDASDEGCIDSATMRHDDHMHISFSLEAGYLHTSLFEALGLEPLVIPPPPEPPPEPPGDASPPDSSN